MLPTERRPAIGDRVSPTDRWEAPPIVPVPRCVSCGAALTGEYCSDCGERRFDPERLHLRHFVGSSFSALTNLDGRLIASVRALAVRPGELTVAWLEGRHRPYLLPIQLFLLANVAYFFILPFTGYNRYNTPLVLQIDGQRYSEPLGIARRVAERLAERGLSYDQYAPAFDAATSIYSRSLLIALVPMLALGLFALFPRGPKTRHLVFATHYYAFELLFVTAFILGFSMIWPATAAVAAGWGAPRQLLFLIGEFTPIPLILVYLYLAIRRVYHPSRFRTVVSLVAILFIYGAVTFLYRLLLFTVSFANV